MQRNLAFYIFISLIACGIFLTLLPYPTFYSGSYNLSHNDIAKIGDKNENEDYSNSTPPQTTAVLTKLDWFECVNSIMPYNSAMKIIDVRTKVEFNVSRIGGSLHADVFPSQAEDKQIIETLFGYEANQKRPVIIEILPNVWTAASLSGRIVNNENESHYCLHFYNSKSHSTQMSDINHQKSINYAYKNGKNIIDKK